MKILHVTTDAITLKSFLLPIPLHFNDRNCRVDCAASNIDDYPEISQCFYNSYNLPFSRSLSSFKSHIISLKKIKELVGQEKYDIVHVHTPIASFLVRFALRKMRLAKQTKVVYTAHGFHFYKGGQRLSNFIYSTAEKVAGNWTDKLVVINREDYDSAKGLKIVKKADLVYMPGIGVDLKVYKRHGFNCAEKQTFLKSIGIENNSFIFLMIAEFIPRKNHNLVIEAFSKIKSKNAYLLLAGNGPEKENLVKLANNLGVSEKILFLGYRKDISKLISVSSATILFSKHEGLPRSSLESYAAGVPVIAANIRGLNDLIETGGGVLIDNHDTNALADTIDHIVTDEVYREKLSSETQKVIEKYSLDNILDDHNQLYMELAKDLECN